MQARHKVYILHGWGNPKSIMHKVEKKVKKAGFEHENYAYPGLMVDLDSLGYLLYQDVKNEAFDSVSFVTHSMGGLVFRSMLKFSGMDADLPFIYRVVMIAPPNQGAAIADLFDPEKKLNKFLGPNVQRMQTDSGSFVNTIPYPYNIEIGIIIGCRGKDIGYNVFIEGDNDGLVKPEHTLLGNEQDTIVFKLDHLALIRRRKPRKEVVEFLKYGTFHYVKTEDRRRK
ncbi:MAG: hypothetical protein C0596_02360 [Marinilabiliales bacterium]|nr:MAG: hypothetical protein C0596_02360 [Marinilabiliales bacterium]